MRNGKLQLLWDNEVIYTKANAQSWNTYSKKECQKRNHTISANYFKKNIDIASPGTGHELVIQFTPIKRENEAFFRMVAPAIRVDPTFAFCEDNKVCLRELGKDGA